MLESTILFIPGYRVRTGQIKTEFVLFFWKQKQQP